MKRFLSFALVALLLVCSLVTFSPAAVAAQYEAPDTVVIYVGYPTYQKVYSFDIGDGYTWQDLCSDHSSSSSTVPTEGPRIQTWEDKVLLITPDGTWPIYSLSGVKQKDTDTISNASYMAGNPVEFTIEPYGDGVASGTKYTLSCFATDLTFEGLARHAAVIDGGDLGNCRFYKLGDSVVLRTGVSSVNGSYDAQFVLALPDTGTIVTPEHKLSSTHYYAMSICEGLNEHDYSGNPNVITEPTCTTKGFGQFTCRYCGFSEFKDIAPLGHYYDDNGVCKREGCIAVDPGTVAGNVVGGIGDFFGDLGDRVSDGYENIKDRFKDWFDPGVEEIKERGSNLLLLLGLGFMTVLILILRKPFLILVKLIKKAINWIGSKVRSTKRKRKTT